MRTLRIIFYLGLIFFSSCFWTRYYRVEHNYDEIHYVETIDQWRLALYRYEPKFIDNNKVPIILCHGFQVNRHDFDLDSEHSLALYLRDRGYDIWLAELRGNGGSAIKKQKVKRSDWNLDDHINKDLPKIIEYIKEITNSTQVNWIGHSLGAMVMVPYLELNDQSTIRSFIAIAPPIYFIDAGDMIKALPKWKWIFNYKKILPTEALGKMAIPLVRFIKNLFIIGINPENIDDKVVKEFLANGVSDTPKGVILQFFDWIETGSFRSADKKIDYLANLDKISIPILIVIGKVDGFVPPTTGFWLYNHISSEDKEIRILSVENGYSQDYGHGDMSLGINARDEVFPYIYEWVNKRNRKETYVN